MFIIKIYLYLQFVAAILAILRFFTCRHKKLAGKIEHLSEEFGKRDV